MLLRLHVKCNPYIYNVRDDIKDAASYIINVRVTFIICQRSRLGLLPTL
jgi:hypothetical protein